MAAASVARPRSARRLAVAERISGGGVQGVGVDAAGPEGLDGLLEFAAAADARVAEEGGGRERSGGCSVQSWEFLGVVRWSGGADGSAGSAGELGGGPYGCAAAAAARAGQRELVQHLQGAGVSLKV